MPKQVLFSFHGIRTRGEWQDQAAPLLQHFFDYRPQRYHRYEHQIGAIFCMAGDLISAGLLTGFWLCYAYYERFRTPTVSVHVRWIVVLLVYSVANVLVRERMKAQVRDVRQMVHEAVPKATWERGLGASIIAHSLGSYLVCEGIYEGFMPLDVVILHASVIQRNYPWHVVRRGFQHVFNEIAGRDLYPLLTLFLRGSMPGMGISGILGFDEGWGEYRSSPVISRGIFRAERVGPAIADLQACCPPHRKILPVARMVHNIRYAKYWHSSFWKEKPEWLCGFEHARLCWLPRLFHYDPILYRQFYKDCEVWFQSVDEFGIGNDAKLAEIGGTCWGWTKEHGSLDSYLLSLVRSFGKTRWTMEESRRLAAYSLRILASKTTESLQELSALNVIKEDDPRWIFLSPRESALKMVWVAMDLAKEEGRIPEWTEA